MTQRRLAVLTFGALLIGLVALPFLLALVVTVADLGSAPEIGLAGGLAAWAAGGVWLAVRYWRERRGRRVHGSGFWWVSAVYNVGCIAGMIAAMATAWEWPEREHPLAWALGTLIVWCLFVAVASGSAALKTGERRLSPAAVSRGA